MPNFHALAVFEASGPSTEEIQEAVSSRFASFSHQRVRYHEHELSTGPSAASAGKNSYCMVFVDCDVDAYTEEKALDFANDAFEYLSTETCQYLAFGLVPGRQRVQHRREEARDADTNERGGRRRGTQGRGRRRRDDQERDRGTQQETEQTQVAQEEAPSTPELLNQVNRLPLQSRRDRRLPLSRKRLKRRPNLRWTLRPASLPPRRPAVLRPCR